MEGANSGSFKSTPRTQYPSCLRRFTMWLPMKPPAPHTNAVRTPISSSSENRFEVGLQAERRHVVRRQELGAGTIGLTLLCCRDSSGVGACGRHQKLPSQVGGG